MIIFDLDGTLADCEHRRHFVDPEKNENVLTNIYYSKGNLHRQYFYKDSTNEFTPDWKSFYEACDKDEVIIPVALQFYALVERYGIKHLHIWSGRCESVRDKTIRWITKYLSDDLDFSTQLKMRPISDNTPDDQLKEKWLDEELAKGNNIEFVFDDRPKVIRMWHRRGMFVFNCCQHHGEF